MELKLKPEYTDQIITSPFTGLDVHLKFLPVEMFIHYYKKGYTWLFETVEEKKTKKD